MIWERSHYGWLLELGKFYVHWNAPPLPSLWIGWMGRRHVYLSVSCGAEAEW